MTALKLLKKRAGVLYAASLTRTRTASRSGFHTRTHACTHARVRAHTRTHFRPTHVPAFTFIDLLTLLRAPFPGRRVPGAMCRPCVSFITFSSPVHQCEVGGGRRVLQTLVWLLAPLHGGLTVRKTRVHLPCSSLRPSVSPTPSPVCKHHELIQTRPQRSVQCFPVRTTQTSEHVK